MRYLNEGDFYHIDVIKWNGEFDEYIFDSSHTSETTCLDRCKKLTSQGIPEYNIQLSSYDIDYECESGISFVDSINYEEVI